MCPHLGRHATNLDWCVILCRPFLFIISNNLRWSSCRTAIQFYIPFKQSIRTMCSNEINLKLLLIWIAPVIEQLHTIDIEMSKLHFINAFARDLDEMILHSGSMVQVLSRRANNTSWPIYKQAKAMITCWMIKNMWLGILHTSTNDVLCGGKKSSTPRCTNIEKLDIKEMQRLLKWCHFHLFYPQPRKHINSHQHSRGSTCHHIIINMVCAIMISIMEFLIDGYKSVNVSCPLNKISVRI